MFLKKSIDLQQQNAPLPQVFADQDYAASWLLYGISKNPILRNHLVFKGGNCLRKCYFEDCRRFSQDLDFSVVGDFPEEEVLEELIRDACDFIQAAFLERGKDIKISVIPIILNEFKTFMIWFKSPRDKNPEPNINIYLSFPKSTSFPLLEKEITPPCNEPILIIMKTYSLEEMVCEKIADLLEARHQLGKGKWERHRYRDYYDLPLHCYDLWTIFKNSPTLNKNLIPEITRLKCQERLIPFCSIEALFDDTLMLDVTMFWQLFIKQFVPNCPPQEHILKEVKITLKEIFD